MFFEVVYEEVEELDDEDEFFFESIQRYNTLQMFNLENIPYHLLQLDDTSVCVASKRIKGENSELLKLRLPGRLSLPLEEQATSGENHFTVISGIFTKDLVYQIDKMEDKIITSENNCSGLQIYSFADGSLETQNQDQKLEITPWPATDFAVIEETKNVICCKFCDEPLIMADASVGQIIKEIHHPFYTPDTQRENLAHNPSSGSYERINPCYANNIKCKGLNPDQIAILSTHSGEVALHDLRSKDSFVSLSGNSKTQEIWTLSSFDYREYSLNYFGIMSNTSSVRIYDKRNNSVLIENTGNDDPKENYCWMRLKFNNDSNVFSISGLNSFVEIFRINGEQFELAFTHKGHCPSNLPTVLSTDHIWLQAGGNEYVISVSDNNTLNCWDGIF